ncbi:MAG: tetratricopeptide repeat protein [Planctomycetes bacterium]|nr:tetratricopeptide repeat protein [Planctomycetota bacterium]
MFSVSPAAPTGRSVAVLALLAVSAWAAGCAVAVPFPASLRRAGEAGRAGGETAVDRAVAALMAQGRERARRGEWGRAADVFEAAAAHSVGEAASEALMQAGHAARAAGDHARAARLFGEAAARKPELAAAHHHLGLSCEALGRVEEAREHLARACRLAPHRPSLLAAHARVAAATGRFLEAEESLVAALRLAPDNAGLLLARGSLAEARGRLDEAASWYERAAGRDPRSAEAARALARVSLARGDAAKAFAVLERAAPASGDAALHVDLARAALVLGRPALAGDALSRALALDRRCRDALLLLGDLALGRGEPESAAGFYRMAEALPPAAPLAGMDRALWEAGDAALARGDADRARPFFAELRERRPASPEAAVGLASTARAAGRLDEAEHLLADVADPAEGDAAWRAREERGMALFARRGWRAAETHLLAAVRGSAGRAREALPALVRCRMALGDWQEALDAVRLWTARESGRDPDALHALFVCLSRSGEPPALDEMLAAEAKFPAHEGLRLLAARGLAEGRRYGEACARLASFPAETQEGREAADLLDDLNSRVLPALVAGAAARADLGDWPGAMESAALAMAITPDGPRAGAAHSLRLESLALARRWSEFDEVALAAASSAARFPDENEGRFWAECVKARAGDEAARSALRARAARPSPPRPFALAAHVLADVAPKTPPPARAVLWNRFTRAADILPAYRSTAAVGAASEGLLAFDFLRLAMAGVATGLRR